ncbi:MAG: hypothetical protein GKR93_02885 [Gammaproteobacteria bacterium]|nr:hypothetical protein [Gammaproteobacteria bacterium]
MLPASDERKQIARLFNFLLMGEQLAHDCARRQSLIFEDTPSRRFLQAQARQEALHAKIFKAGIGILAPRGIGEPLAQTEMSQYRSLLESALDRGDKLESLLGMQILLEGMGDVALKRISSGFASRNLAFNRVRKLIVGQEDAHHNFGLRRFQQLIGSQASEWQGMRYQSELYLEVLNNMLHTLQPFFEFFDEHAEDYIDELQGMLPANMKLAVA